MLSGSPQMSWFLFDLRRWLVRNHRHGGDLSSRVADRRCSDIYGAHHKYIELFPKTQINNHGNEKSGGLVWEWDPVRHRKVSKQISPAFSGRALKAKEPTLHKYINLFVQHMEVSGGGTEGVSLPQWVNWLCVDMSGDMAYNREMNAMRDSKLPMQYFTETGRYLTAV